MKGKPEAGLAAVGIAPVGDIFGTGRVSPLARDRFASLLTLMLWACVLATSIIVQAPQPAFGQSRDDLDKRSRALYGAGRYTEAIPLAEQLLRRSETEPGKNHLGTADALNLLANLYWNQGRYADAEPLYKRALAIREKALGAEHPTVAQSLINQLLEPTCNLLHRGSASKAILPPDQGHTAGNGLLCPRSIQPVSHEQPRSWHHNPTGRPRTETS
jgi:tetratricopeptide (TPR) repeat protein